MKRRRGKKSSRQSNNSTPRCIRQNMTYTVRQRRKKTTAAGERGPDMPLCSSQQPDVEKYSSDQPRSLQQPKPPVTPKLPFCLVQVTKSERKLMYHTLGEVVLLQKHPEKKQDKEKNVSAVKVLLCLC